MSGIGSAGSMVYIARSKTRRNMCRTNTYGFNKITSPVINTTSDIITLMIWVGGPFRKIESGIEFRPEKDSVVPADKNEARKNDSNVGPTRKPQPY